MSQTINWYPGHMKKTRELIQENIKAVDCVIEILDARIPRSSRNPIIDQLVGEKTRVVLLNKSDLARPKETKDWIEQIEKSEGIGLAVDAQKGTGIKPLLKILDKISQERTGNRANRPFRIMVVGVPNVGKSSFINRMIGKKGAMTGDRPGVTKGKQWLTLPNGMQLLDTPGILWPKFEDPKVGLKLAFCGAVKDEVMDAPELALSLIELLLEDHQGLLEERYSIEIGETPLETMECIGEKRGFKRKGNIIDYERTARTIIDEFRGGKMGLITLEKVK